MNQVEGKTCPCCGVEKAVSEFYKNRAKKDGLATQCKPCKNAMQKKWDSENKDAVRAVHQRWVASNKEQVAEIHRSYVARNRESVRAKNLAWELANKGRRAVQRKIRTTEKREESRAYDAARYAADPEKNQAAARAWKAANPERAKASAVQWAKQNPHKVRAQASRRRATKLCAMPLWYGDRDREVEVGLCDMAVALERATGEKWHVDHIYPLLGKDVCGLHVWQNLRVIPATLNISKNNRTDASLEAVKCNYHDGLEHILSQRAGMHYASFTQKAKGS